MNKDGNALNYDCPKATKLQRVGIFNGSCYVSKMQQVFTATTNGVFDFSITIDTITNSRQFLSDVMNVIVSGCILVWGNVSLEEERKINNSNCEKKKKHIKTVNLQKCNITVIIENDKYFL